MRIAATSDLHFDLIRTEQDRQDLEQLTISLKAEHPDVLVIAGDTVGLGWPKLPQILETFTGVAPERLIVLGNHEYWSADRDTYKHLDALSEIIQASGFHLLDNTPKIIDDVGFAGNCGWYDYSFAQNNPPPNTSYELKMFQGDIIWNDAFMVRLGRTDPEYSVELLRNLENHLFELERRVERIVAVTHLIGFPEMAIPFKENPLYNFINAYLGSISLGEMLLRHPKVKYHLCGHTHRRFRVEKNHLVSINVSSDYHRKEYIMLEI